MVLWHGLSVVFLCFASQGCAAHWNGRLGGFAVALALHGSQHIFSQCITHNHIAWHHVTFHSIPLHPMTSAHIRSWHHIASRHILSHHTSHHTSHHMTWHRMTWPDMTSLNQPHYPSSRRLTTRHTTSHRITSQHSPSHHINVTSHHITSPPPTCRGNATCRHKNTTARKPGAHQNLGCGTAQVGGLARIYKGIFFCPPEPYSPGSPRDHRQVLIFPKLPHPLPENCWFV